MNSYNDNLHSSVVTSLNAQELELQNLKVKKDAATFSMYYAQGARITAAEKLELTTSKYKFQQQVNNQAIIDSDLSTNVLTSANNVKTYVAKSVSNTSVAAANVQIAANAILKLASDVGSIFSIINAADFGTDIYNQAADVKSHMDKTAYLAEKTSQHSMEASSLIAEVPAATLASKATVGDTSVKDLLKVVTTQLDATTAELTTETTKLAEANTDEKKSEGGLEDINAVYHATEMAYRLANKELNLALGVNVEPEIDITSNEPQAHVKRVGDETDYTVKFNPYQAPFKGLFKEKKDERVKYNPVENYYLFLAKISKKSTFSISEAEGLIAEDRTSHYVRITQKEYEEVANFPKKISQKIFTSQLLDTDGDKMALGTDYVIFVLAELRNNYKKLINSFDNYLSAASAKFMLTNQLNTAETKSINVLPKSTNQTSNTPTKQTLTFNVWESPDYLYGGPIPTNSVKTIESKIAYRCMFLPHNPNLITGLLTEEGLNAIESETESLEKIADEYDPRIKKLSTQITSMRSEITGVDKQIEVNKAALKANLSKQKNKNITSVETKELKEEEKDLIGKGDQLTKNKEKLTIDLKKDQDELTLLKTGKIASIAKLENKKVHVKPGFYFDLLTAENVPAGSYTLANNVPGSILESLSVDVINILNDVKKIELDVSKYESDVTSFEKKIAQFIKNLGNTKNIETVKNNIISELEKLKTIFGDLKIIKRDVEKLINDIIKMINDITSEDTLAKALTDIQVLLDGKHYLTKGYICSGKEMVIEPDTTDNFGNRLINNNNYIPVILSIMNTNAEENQQYTNALSDFQAKNIDFTYGTINTLELITY